MKNAIYIIIRDARDCKPTGKDGLRRRPKVETPSVLLDLR